MRQVLKRPILSEKSASFEPAGKYVFEVIPSANKIEIRKAVEHRYGVKVANVHTINIKPRDKSRWTNKGLIAGRTVQRKKAIVTLAKGQTIDILGEVEEGNL